MYLRRQAAATAHAQLSTEAYCSQEDVKTRINYLVNKFTNSIDADSQESITTSDERSEKAVTIIYGSQDLLVSTQGLNEIYRKNQTRPKTL